MKTEHVYLSAVALKCLPICVALIVTHNIHCLWFLLIAGVSTYKETTTTSKNPEK